MRPDGSDSTRAFTLEESIEIAVHSALKSHRAFHPTLERKFSGNIDLGSADLLLVVDAIFIAFDNIKRHSGLDNNQFININCDFINDSNLLRLEIVNNVSEKIDKNLVEEKLEKTRTAISKGLLGKLARREGGSGFLKIAASLRHSAGGKIEFGFMGDHKFRMILELIPSKLFLAVVK